MKVQMNVQPLDGGFAGVPTYIRNMVAEMRACHPELRLDFVADHPVPELPERMQRQLGPSVRDLKTKLLWENLRFPIDTLAVRPDVVHLPYHAATSWGAGRRVITIHDTFLWDHPPTARAERINLRLLEHAARQAHLILTDSMFSKKRIERLFGIDAERIRVTLLASAPDIAVVRPPDAIAAFRRRYGIGERSIFYAGGTAAHKAIDLLVNAYASLDSDLRAVTDLVIAGRFDAGVPHHKAVLAAIEECPRPGRVILTGIIPQDELGVAYQSASVFVFPSLYEGFGLSPLEAMQCGLPVIASNRASIPEVVGDAGLLIDPANPIQITEALTRVLTEADLERDMRARSLARSQTFTWRRTADLTVDAYRHVLGR